jgi:DNA repair exonuclease SbcCD ATPase subunit
MQFCKGKAMRRCTSITAALAAVVLAALPVTAGAQSFRCTGKDGKRYYGQVVPRECIGQPYEQLNSQGLVIKRIEPFVKEVDPAVKAAEEKKKREQALARREEARRARALLATYTSTKDIEGARARALAPIKRQIDNIEADIERLQKRIDKLKKKKGAQNESAIQSARSQMETQSSLLAYKKQEAEDINTRYDSDKKRYIELTRGR